MKTRRELGFTLIELMIVMVILGLLAATALPAFTLYARRAAASEATSNVQRIFVAQCSYNAETHERGLLGSFVDAPLTPSSPPSSAKYPEGAGGWSSSPSWSALGFGVDSRHYYQYASPGAQNGFTSMAFGDLDGDGRRSSFSRRGSISAGEVVGDRLIVTDESE